MFDSGGAVLKRGYVWNETWIAATMYTCERITLLQDVDRHLRFQFEGASKAWTHRAQLLLIDASWMKVSSGG